jgi:hypothetical protein
MTAPARPKLSPPCRQNASQETDVSIATTCIRVDLACSRVELAGIRVDLAKERVPSGSSGIGRPRNSEELVTRLVQQATNCSVAVATYYSRRSTTRSSLPSLRCWPISREATGTFVTY